MQIKCIFVQGRLRLNHECNVDPADRRQAILAHTFRARANVAFWWSPRINIALRS